MATLVKRLPPGHFQERDKDGNMRCIEVDDKGRKTPGEQCAGYKQHLGREYESVGKLPANRVWRQQVADGYAVYYIVSEKPLKLAHVAVGDGYNVHTVTIRGLRLKDVQQAQEVEQRMAEFLARNRTTE